MTARWVGVDGCRAGWVAVTRIPGEDPTLSVEPDFARVLGKAGAVATIAVDMPIGLPDRTGPGGRPAEVAVRKRLGARQSSVFSIPARSAVYAEPGPFADTDARYAAHKRASEVAKAHSDPPRGISIQAFGLFPKVREIDGLMTPALEARVFESHPELAFWRLNGERPMSLPKKVKNRASGPGIEERQALLARHGYAMDFLTQPLPPGVGRDDLIDAAVLALIAERIARGEAQPFPADAPRDGKGLRMAIWA